MLLATRQHSVVTHKGDRCLPIVQGVAAAVACFCRAHACGRTKQQRRLIPSVSIFSRLGLAQEQLITLNCLMDMNSWNTGAGRALTKSVIMVAHAVRNSLQGVPNQFSAAELLQVSS